VAERWIVGRPTGADRSDQRFFLVTLSTQPPATCVPTVEHEIGDPVRVPRGVCNRDGGTLRYAQERKSFKAGGFDNRLQIADPRIDRRLADFGV
jgi:hypothetical protein